MHMHKLSFGHLLIYCTTCAMFKKIKQKTSLVGLEPTTFELEVQCANPLRHRD